MLEYGLLLLWLKWSLTYAQFSLLFSPSDKSVSVMSIDVKSYTEWRNLFKRYFLNYFFICSVLFSTQLTQSTFTRPAENSFVWVFCLHGTTLPVLEFRRVAVPCEIFQPVENSFGAVWELKRIIISFLLSFFFACCSINSIQKTDILKWQ